ncbi:MAG: type II toxin-antitoxin system HicB family antitoxin [Acidobacteriota bacterium]|nr:type II toxin-antitoxin system HicB family antitoxin [Acidobacteriota bacterium]
MLRYPATIRPDGKTFVVLFPALPFAHTNGDSREDALAHAPDALHTALSMLMEKNLDIPEPGKLRRGAVLVGLPSVTTDAKVALYKALRSSGVRKAELARRMGIHKQQIDRLLDIDHASRIEQLESAFAALQMRLTVDIQPADLAA